jgi:hypothetical protein
MMMHTSSMAPLVQQRRSRIATFATSQEQQNRDRNLLPAMDQNGPLMTLLRRSSEIESNVATRRKSPQIV